MHPLRLLSPVLICGILAGGKPSAAQSPTPDIAASYQNVADSLIGAATRDSAAYQRLGKLVDTFGHRFSGSASLEAAIDWVLNEMKADGSR